MAPTCPGSLGRRGNPHTPWRKDACLLEDKTRSRNPSLVGTLAMLRNILLFMHKEQDLHATLPGFVEETAADKNKVFSMLMRRY